MHDLPTIEASTRAYETWMARYTPLVRADLALKHAQMRSNAFRFLRATYYRWQQVWPAISGDAAKAPAVLAVADLHVENFGTWRDLEGRLIWGVNDFDEASQLPYTNDLIRLTTSAFLAVDAAHLHLSHAAAAQAILDGYHEGLRTGGRPFVLEADHHGLRHLALSELRDPGAFWEKLQASRRFTGTLPRGGNKALAALLPDGITSHVIRRRVAGMGSLGRPRFVAIAEYHGAPIAREAKARIPSASVWDGAPQTDQDILKQAVRVPDPYFQVRRRWIVRRIAPDCSRIELAHVPQGHDEHRLLHAMGAETANIHLGSASARGLLRDLATRSDTWIEESARAMAEAMLHDWKRWQHHG